MQLFIFGIKMGNRRHKHHCQSFWRFGYTSRMSLSAYRYPIPSHKKPKSEYICCVFFEIVSLLVAIHGEELVYVCNMTLFEFESTFHHIDWLLGQPIDVERVITTWRNGSSVVPMPDDFRLGVLLLLRVPGTAIRKREALLGVKMHILVSNGGCSCGTTWCVNNPWFREG